MLKLKNISFNDTNDVDSNVSGVHYGLGTMQSTWGPINDPTIIKNSEDLITKFGLYDESNKNDWFQCYNFLQYSNMLKIYRFAKKSSSATFDSTSKYLDTLDGSSNAHMFINSINDGYIRVWNETDNGSNVYIRLNDSVDEKYEPTFGTEQILFAYAKYCGTKGNGIGVTIANYYTDLTTNYAFRQYDQISVTTPSIFTVGDSVVSENGAYGDIIKIDGDILHIDTTNSSFSVNDNIDIDNISSTPTYSSALDYVVSNQEKEEVEINYTLQDIFQRSIGIAEVGIVLTYDNEILESGIFSLDNTKTNYIVEWENDWVQFKMDSSYSIPTASESIATHQTKMPLEITNRKLVWGVNTDLQNSDIVDQLEKLKNRYFCDFSIMFMDEASNDVRVKLNEIKIARDDVEIFVNTYEDDVDGNFLITNFEEYIITNDLNYLEYIDSDTEYLGTETSDEYIVDEDSDVIILDL